MKANILLLISIATLGLASCKKTDWTVVPNRSILANYHFAAMNYVASENGAATLTDQEFKVYEALTTTRLMVVGEGQIETLSAGQKQQLLTVRVSSSVSVDSKRTIVSIDFVDYMTGRPLASCKGAWGAGLTEKRNMRVATDKAIDEMKKLF